MNAVALRRSGSEKPLQESNRLSCSVRPCSSTPHPPPTPRCSRLPGL